MPTPIRLRWTSIIEAIGRAGYRAGEQIAIALDPASSEIANSVLIKLNQIGTLTETIEAVQLDRRTVPIPCYVGQCLVLWLCAMDPARTV